MFHIKDVKKKCFAFLLAFILLDGCSTTQQTDLKTTSKSTTCINSKNGLNVRKCVLKNGLKVLIAPNPKLPIVSYYTLFDVGGRDEGPGTTGATHFLEHMMFKGAKKYGPGEFDGRLERSGGETNAYTTNDMTVYYENIPSSFLDTMIDMEADRMQNLLLEPASFESERKVIFEERKMRYENSPEGLIYLEMLKKIFAGTPYAQSVIGEESDLAQLSRDQMMEFFRNYYVPNNAIIAIAGDVNPDELIAKIEEKYGGIPASALLSTLKEKSSSAHAYEAKPILGKEYKIYATNPLPQFVIVYPGEKIGVRKAYVLDLVAMILGTGGSSYLHQNYVKSKKPILKEISTSNYNLIHGGAFYISGDLLPGKKLKNVKTTLENDLKGICPKAIFAKSLQKAKNQIMSQAYEHLKTNAGVASMLVLNEKYFNDYSYGMKEIEIYNSITEEEAINTCRNLLQGTSGIFISTWDKYQKKLGVK